MIRTLIDLMERGLLPDAAVRFGVRRLLRQRLAEEAERRRVDGTAADEALIAAWSAGPIAVHADKANEQHYELPAAFFRRVMGEHLKYSSGYWPEPDVTLSQAEASMLALSCERAEIGDGQRVLELGCGWGSLSLWLAANYPAASITAVSNSASQRRFIERERDRRGHQNLELITADVSDFEPGRRFDRVVSVEMFEHLRNHRELLRRISGWLNPGGKLFVHVFSHRRYLYPFETDGEDNWMGRYFFTGGVMPSRELLPRLQQDLRLERQWHLDGRHYQRTCEAWLANQDRYREELMPVLAEVYGEAQAARWFQRWRVFFIACAELFGYAGGQEWGVSHYRFVRPQAGR